ncbi:MAG TPA: excinuclease ABC subunit UvrC [Anaerolineae bacterium]|nr:excinuclease ABC subunit UvrC [Anaerolineae bacterium]
MLRPDLQEKLNAIPTKPGVYLYKNQTQKVIYVGKAINLRNRVRSYFHKSSSSNLRLHNLVRDIRDIEFIITGSELEALLLENTLIKKYQPKYNVLLKDDKRYPYIKVHYQEPFPRVTTTRQILNDGARYFGPYTAAWAAYQTLDLIRKIYPYLTCTRNITGQDKRACLYYHIGRCAAPCIGAVTQDEYRAVIDDLCDFLAGNTKEMTQKLTREMQQAAEVLDFERAAALRDQLKAIDQIVQKQKVISPDMIDEDVIAFARANNDTCVQVFFIRGGKLMGREYFLLDGVDNADDKEIMASFLKQFYNQVNDIPPQILLPQEVDELMIIRDWLKNKRGAKVTLKVPRRGKKRALVAMAAENAAETLAHLKAQWDLDQGKQTQALSELREKLHLPEDPLRIECYDISTLQGTHTVASMVVFAKGVARKSDYRRFKMKTAVGKPDDFAAMEETLRRRFKRMQDAQQTAKIAAPGKANEVNPWTLLPNLIIIDGGKGQLNAALKVLDEFDLRDVIPIVSLAKKEEEVFLPGQSESILLPRHSQALYMIQRIRDEAHRFAITYNRALRRKAGVASQLDSIPGVGPKRRKALLKAFGSVKKIRQATVETIAAVPGINLSLAETIKSLL